jgi:hypothetical protein
MSTEGNKKAVLAYFAALGRKDVEGMSRYPRSPVRWFHSPESVRGRRAIAVPPRRRVFDRYEPHRVQWMLPREILAHQSDLLRNDRRAGARSERQCSPWISSKGSNQTSSRRAPRPSRSRTASPIAPRSRMPPTGKPATGCCNPGAQAPPLPWAQKAERIGVPPPHHGGGPT